MPPNEFAARRMMRIVKVGSDEDSPFILLHGGMTPPDAVP